MATTSRKKTTGKNSTRKKTSSKRERISPNGDTRFVRRDGQGQFKESDDAGRSLAQDRKRKAKTVAKSGQGDRGDRPKGGTKKRSTKRAKKR